MQIRACTNGRRNLAFGRKTREWEIRREEIAQGPSQSYRTGLARTETTLTIKSQFFDRLVLALRSFLKVRMEQSANIQSNPSPSRPLIRFMIEHIKFFTMSAPFSITVYSIFIIINLWSKSFPEYPSKKMTVKEHICLNQLGRYGKLSVEKIN